MFRKPLLALAALTLIPGCYSEGITIVDLVGTVRVPKEAATFTATREVVNAGGDIEVVSETFTDIRAIGPVFIGLYPSVENNLEPYPHPERGPGVSGDRGISYPYGGTTIGRFANACFEALTCRVVSGRYADYDEIIDWFNNFVGDPIDDGAGGTIQSGEFLRQTCLQILELTSDEEIRILPRDDNADGVVDAQDLDFLDAGDFFEAEFTIYQAEFFEGMSAWAFLDNANSIDFTHSTCNPAEGYFENTYNRRYQAGTQFADVLNTPFEYIDDEDWVSSEAFIWDDPFTPADLTLDLSVASTRDEGDN
jgi:hypothetical protein